MGLRERLYRARSWSHGDRWQRGRLDVHGEVSVAALPLPYVGVLFEETTFALSGGVATHNGVLVGLAVAVVLPDDAADALCVLWPGRVRRRGRRESAGRLVVSARRRLAAARSR